MSNADGVVIIEAEMETKGIDKGIASIEAKMEKLRKKAEQPYTIDIDGRSIEVAGDWNLSKEEQQYYDRLQASLNKLQLQKTEMLMTDNQITQNIGEQAEKQEEISSSLNKWVDGVMQIADDLYVVKKDTSEISDEAKKINLNFDNIGKSMNNIVKKAVKWGLAIFGIRGIYMGIRQVVNQIMQEDENLKYQVDYIKWSIGQSIKPIVEFIVNLVYKIVAGVGAIIKLIFGINIFSKATANNFKKANAGAGKLRKTLTGFDEMNILNEDGSVGIGNNIDKALEGFGDISKEVDKISVKIKKWFLGGDYATLGEALIENMKKVPSNMIELFRPAYDKVFKPYLVDPMLRVANQWIEDLKPIWIPIKNAFTTTINELKPKWTEFKTFMSSKIEQLKPIWEPVKNAFINTKNKILEYFAPFLNKLIDGFNYVFGWLGWHLDYIEVEAEKTGDKITTEVGDSLKDVDKIKIGDKDFTINIDANMSNAERKTNNWIDGLKNNISSIKNWFSNIGLTIKSYFGFSKGGIVVPRLARGGIINAPGRGVPIGSAIGGERGQEGVIPLTDSQQMELLGEAIGKYININATIPVYVGNRQITREIRKINAEDDFAYNR